MDQKKLSKILVKELEEWIYSSNYSSAKATELVDRILKKVQKDTVSDYKKFTAHQLDEKQTKIFLKILAELETEFKAK